MAGLVIGCVILDNAVYADGRRIEPRGYPFSLLLMATTSALLYLRFKRSGWL